MSRNLSELSLEELWELFPIFLTEHKQAWQDDYIQQEHVLAYALQQFQIKRIAHIGSTAIDSIWAKPIIDILVEIEKDEKMENVAAVIEQNGFTRMSEEKGRISFNRGYTECGFAEQVYHLHLRYANDNDELYFRDYMNTHPKESKAYEKLKLKLWKQYEHNRDGYTAAKTEFVETYTKKAKLLYGDRYH